MAADLRSDLDRSSTSVSITAGSLSRVRASARTVPLAITPDLIDKGMGITFLKSGGSGNDLYNFLRGDGQDTIIDSDPFPGNQDRTTFGATINPLDLVISRQANDLRLTIHGSSDQITVQNWYTSSANRIETIQAGNGQTMLTAQVDQLIQAMASFTTQTGLTWDQAIDQRPQEVQTVLAASWQ